MMLLYLSALLTLISGNDGTLDLTALSQQVNCTDPQSMLTTAQECLDAYKLPLKLPSYAELMNSSHPSIFGLISKLITQAYLPDMCRNLDAFQKGLECALKRISRCTSDMSALPAKLRNIQEYACANLDKFNITCMYEKTFETWACSNTFEYMTTSDFSMTGTEHKSACMSHKLTPVCEQRYLATCGEVAVHVTKAYQPNNTECLQPNSLDTPTVDCSTTENIRKSYHQCFAYNGIPFHFPENETIEVTGRLIMDAITMDDNLCSNLKDYQQVVNCTLHAQKQCSDDAMKPMVADSQTVQDGLAKLCGHIGDFDAKCVQNAPKGTCGSRRRALDTKQLCAATRATQNCLVSAVSSCSKKTVRMYKDFLLSQSPSVCLKQATGSLVIG